MLGRKKGMTLKLCPLIGYYIRNIFIFIGKSCRKCAPEAIPRPLLNFWPLHARNFFKNKIFSKRIIKKP